MKVGAAITRYSHVATVHLSSNYLSATLILAPPPSDVYFGHNVSANLSCNYFFVAL